MKTNSTHAECLALECGGGGKRGKIEKGEEGRLEDEEKRYERGKRKQKREKGEGWGKTEPNRELEYKEEGEGESIYLLPYWCTNCLQQSFSLHGSRAEEEGSESQSN